MSDLQIKSGSDHKSIRESEASDTGSSRRPQRKRKFTKIVKTPSISTATDALHDSCALFLSKAARLAITNDLENMKKVKESADFNIDLLTNNCDRISKRIVELKQQQASSSRSSSGSNTGKGGFKGPKLKTKISRSIDFPLPGASRLLYKHCELFNGKMGRLLITTDLAKLQHTKKSARICIAFLTHARKTVDHRMTEIEKQSASNSQNSS